jgi:PHS family inorganic phosphate transporter-like MFS transporter
MFAGIFSTLLIPETKRRTLEDLAEDWDMGDESITGAHHAPKADNRSSDEAAVNEMKA